VRGGRGGTGLGVTVKLTITECESVPLVAVMFTVYGPGLALSAGTDTVKVVETFPRAARVKL